MPLLHKYSKEPLLQSA